MDKGINNTNNIEIIDNKLDVNSRIEKLEKNISESFIKGKEQIESLIQFASIKNRNELKSKIQESSIILKDGTDIDTLSDYMIELRNLREKTANLTTSLKEELNLEKIKEFISKIKEEDISIISKKLFPNLDYNALSNPKSLKEKLISFTVGSIENIYSILKITYDLGKGIVLSPYHIYQIVSGKAEYEKFKQI